MKQLTTPHYKALEALTGGFNLFRLVGAKYTLIGSVRDLPELIMLLDGRDCLIETLPTAVHTAECVNYKSSRKCICE